MKKICVADSATVRVVLGSTTILTGSALSLAFMLAAPQKAIAAGETIRLGEISVTATKVARETKDVPSAITIIGGQTDGPDSFSFCVENLFDKKRSVKTKKSTSGTRSYVAAQPRTFLMTYVRKF
ncbi:MAG: hypothetical protein OQJ87_12360 [Rhodospirillales bacterium]|nr:hypothetical protein [Rhodospirillales bacterium]MCW8953241.1 hypothetical protein [Rhodospirillales bacterium]MCW8970145.1 hypothetical protein [Rhodospirillales bacterium]MCW9003497.1 hypothetical protein [Rhodospirillales bacterium]MCW9039346.1 hypothetical protein [Rhodospirillales bacterium]